jgi:hypothetical protein
MTSLTGVKSNLVGIEVVCRRKPADAFVQKPLGSNHVCGVEAEIPEELRDAVCAHHRACAPKVEQLLQHARASDKQRVRLEFQKETPHALLTA